MGVAIAILAVLAAVGASARSAPGAGRKAANGLQGLVLQSPTTPVCRQNEPCERPAPGVELVFTPQGRTVSAGRVTTREDGSYRILLPAGIYTVRTNRRVFGHIPFPARVKVRLGHVDHLDFSIDTGIR